MNARSARRRRWAPYVLAAAAVALWLVPLPSPIVERWYSRGLYPVWQNVATLAGNFVPMALFDVLLVALVVLVIVKLVRARRSRSWRAAAERLLLIAALLAIWFQAAWGLNYRRVPIAQRMGMEDARSTPESLDRFALAVAAEAAASAPDLDRETPVTPARMIAELSSGFERAQRRIGLTRLARAGRPKYSLLDPYFRWSAIDGLTNPFIPETIVVSGLVPAEAYATVAHEWAHLAGFASEDEASFVGWLACLEAGGGARYNAWLFALSKALGQAPPDRAHEWITRAGPLVVRDLALIRERFLKSSPAVRRAASAAYDRYLRANRVESGIASYDEVLQLMLAFAPDGRPRL